MLFHFIEPVAKMTTLGLWAHTLDSIFPGSHFPLLYPEVMSHLPHWANKYLLTFSRPERITAEGGVQADSNDLLDQKACAKQNLVLKVFQKTHIRKQMLMELSFEIAWHTETLSDIYQGE